MVSSSLIVPSLILFLSVKKMVSHITFYVFLTKKFHSDRIQALEDKDTYRIRRCIWCIYRSR
jgi:hypothetical protein